MISLKPQQASMASRISLTPLQILLLLAALLAISMPPVQSRKLENRDKPPVPTNIAPPRSSTPSTTPSVLDHHIGRAFPDEKTLWRHEGVPDRSLLRSVPSPGTGH
uniref:Uncharacterized protein n=1 Tax=Kalanchoe fedtschenkoi TaxID=63787 RepID=A0A7N0T4D3_KALFE